MARRAGFTLIEMLAVVTIFAILAGIAIPTVSSLSGRTLRREAQIVAHQIDLARQRSVMTGRPHRVLIDLDASAYRMEWYITEDEANGTSREVRAAAPLSRDAPLPLAAPRDAEREFRPLPGKLGRFVYLEGDVEFAGLEADNGWIESGEIDISFEIDGTTQHSDLQLDDGSGNSVRLEILPLLDSVRIHDEA